MRYTPVRCMPVRYMPIRWTSVRCTPLRDACPCEVHAPVRCTTVSSLASTFLCCFLYWTHFGFRISGNSCCSTLLSLRCPAAVHPRTPRATQTPRRIHSASPKVHPLSHLQWTLTRLHSAIVFSYDPVHQRYCAFLYELHLILDF